MKPISLKPILLFSIFMFSMEMFAQSVPAGVQILRVDAMGSGCKPGSVSTTISPDNKDLSLLFDNFISETGGQVSGVTDKKVCIINIDIAVPDGWSMGLVGADYRGYAAIEVGAIGQHEVLYSFNKSFGGSSFSTRTFQGPFNEPYEVHNDIHPNLVNWSMCNARQITLTMRVSVVTQILRPGGGRQRPSAMVSLDTVDSSLRQSFQVGWRSCQGRPGNPGGGHNDNRNDNRGGGGGRPNFPTDPGRGGANTNMIEIYQMWNGQSRYLTTDSRLTERGTWVNQGIAFGLLRSGFSAVQLYQCLITHQARYFVSTDARCEGHQLERSLGLISQVAQAGMVPLIRYYNPNNLSDRIVTTNAAEASGYIQERIIGFVYKTR